MPLENVPTPDALEHTLRLRPASSSDEPFLRSVYASTRAQELAQVPWPAEQKVAFCEMQFKAQDTHYRDNFPESQFLIIEHNGIPAGRLYVDRREKELHILDIALLPDHQRAGIGTFLLRQLMEEASASSKFVSIYVEKFNPALNLYQRLGFVHISDLGVYNLMEWRPAPQSG